MGAQPDPHGQAGAAELDPGVGRAGQVVRDDDDRVRNRLLSPGLKFYLSHGTYTAPTEGWYSHGGDAEH